jgi:sugar lactone lactonase YvrE
LQEIWQVLRGDHAHLTRLAVTAKVRCQRLRVGFVQRHDLENPAAGRLFQRLADGPVARAGDRLDPPFGANGIEFSNDFSTMYVANTAFHQIIQVPVSNSSGALVAGPPSILTTGINAPDGILVDRKGFIWICANQEDEIVVIDPKGGTNPLNGQKIPKVIAKLGDFGGIDENGIAQGFLFPASPAFSPDGKTLYVSNLTLFLPFAGANVAIDSPWALQVKGYTVSKMSAELPPLPAEAQQ